MTAAATLAFVLWSAQGVDQRELTQQSALVHRIFDHQLQRVPHEQESVSIWDESIANSKVDFDRRWLRDNLGVWMRDFFGHNEIYLLNNRNEPIYAMRAGTDIPPASTGAAVADLAPLLAQLRRKIAGGGIDAYENGTAANPPRAADLMNVEGIPSIASVVPIISDTGATQPHGSEYVLASVIHLDTSYARRLSDEYFLSDLRFGQLHRSDPHTAQIALVNNAGRFVTFVDWRMSSPGAAMLSQTVPAICAAFVVAGLIALILIDQLWRKSRALEVGRADAEHRASHDPLTGLLNRSSFEAALSRAVALGPGPSHRVSLLMMDLDRFKQINDTLGHRAGDDLLEAVGQRLLQFIGPDDTLARLGGDEFAVLHVRSDTPAHPLGLSQRIIDAIGKPFDIADSEAFIGVSIGIATADDQLTDPRELARRADIALYEAKLGGRNRAVVFEESMNEMLQNRRTIEAELREALRRGDQLSVAFQPLFGRDQTRICGAEALARWEHPQLGRISPAHFVPVAEASGLIEQLGAYVLREACRLGARWPGKTFAVNISPVQLRNRDFRNLVFDILDETGMRPQDLELEITEGILLEEASDAAEALRIFRAGGIKIALDDFGTGYSSLNYLKRYPVDRIKIDRSFVSQLQSGGVSVAIVEAMMRLAHAMQIEVTAEGVETREQARVLNDLGCNVYQGFLLSPPVRPDQLEAMLEAAQAVSHLRRVQVA